MNPSAQTEATGKPFWDWLDAGLFAGMTVPAFLGALFLTQATGWVGLALGKAARAMLLQFSLYGLLFLVLLGVFRLRHGEPFWRSLGWRTRWANRRQTLFLGPLAALVVALAGALLHAPPMDSAIRALLTDRWSIALFGVFAVTLGPLCEELIFRGFFLPLLARTFGAVAGVLLTALPFALLHGPQYGWSWRHIVLLSAAAALFGWVRLRTGSTAAATLVHATYNLTFFTGFLIQSKDLPL